MVTDRFSYDEALLEQRTTLEPRSEKTSLRGFQPGDTNLAVQSQKIARGLKFRIYEEEGLY